MTHKWTPYLRKEADTADWPEEELSPVQWQLFEREKQKEAIVGLVEYLLFDPHFNRVRYTEAQATILLAVAAIVRKTNN